MITVFFLDFVFRKKTFSNFFFDENKNMALKNLVGGHPQELKKKSNYVRYPVSSRGVSRTGGGLKTLRFDIIKQMRFSDSTF